MTDEQFREMIDVLATSLKPDNSGLCQKMDRVAEGLTEVTATARISLEQHNREIQALFRMANEQQAANAGFVQRGEQVEKDKAHTIVHGEIDGRVRELETKVSPLIDSAARRAAILSSIIVGVAMLIINIITTLIIKSGVTP